MNDFEKFMLKDIDETSNLYDVEKAICRWLIRASTKEHLMRVTNIQDISHIILVNFPNGAKHFYAYVQKYIGPYIETKVYQIFWFKDIGICTPQNITTREVEKISTFFWRDQDARECGEIYIGKLSIESYDWKK